MKSPVRWLGTWCSGLPQPKTRAGPASPRHPPLLVVVEGPHDVEFLKRIAALLNRQYPELPNLVRAEADGQVTFLPAGGGNLWTLPQRLAPLGLAEWHVYDRELSPVTQQRQQLVDAINARPNCRATLTRKRALENYLHQRAVLQAGGVNVDFGDDDPVPHLVAQAICRGQLNQPAWTDLSQRARKRRCERAKVWLNRRAVDCMTLELLQQRDPEGEIAGWLQSIANMMAVRG